MTDLSRRDREIEESYTDAWNQIVRGNYLTAYESLLELQRLNGDKFEAGRLSLSMGIACHHLRRTDKGMLENAIRHLSSARSQLDKKRNGVEYLQSLYLLAECYCDTEKYEDAYELLVECKNYLGYWDTQECALEYYWYRQLLGNVCLWLDRYPEAVQEYEHARAKVPLMENPAAIDTEINFDIGRVYHYAGDNDNAIKYLETIDPGSLPEDRSFSYYFTMLRHNLGLERYVEALECFTVLQKIGIKEPQKPDAYHFAGVAAYCLRKNEDAEKYFRLSQEFGPRFQWMRDRNVQYLMKMGLIP